MSHIILPQEHSDASTETQNEYFSSYEDLEVHKIMLEDHSRVLAYRMAIMTNASYIKDKVVMDVGTGTGLLAVMCAQAGARKVYAVEASNFSKIARAVVRENLCEDVVEVLECKVEDAMLPGGELVDLIVSEWMGFYLLHEGMLDSVLYARDHFLKPEGHMFPESATVYVAPCRVPSMYEFWESVQGVNMEIMGTLLRQNKAVKPEVALVRPEDLLGQEEALCWINLKEDKLEDIEQYTFKHVFGASCTSRFQGICLWFDCTFPELTENREAPVQLSTSPFAPATHWKQTVVVLPDDIPVEIGEPIAFQLQMKRAADSPRRYNLELTLLDPEEVDHPTPCSCHMTKCIIIKKFIQDHPEPSNSDRQTSEGSILDDKEYYSGSDSD